MRKYQQGSTDSAVLRLHGGERAKITRLAAILAGASVLALTLAGCSASAVKSPVGAVESLNTDTVTVSYTGQVQRITVPAGVTAAALTVKGASGYNLPNSNGYNQGWGAVVSGTVLVHGGDVLTVAAGQQGGANNGNKSPGVGGWALPDGTYAGGNGGHGIGEMSWDGAGGGGASVVEFNDKLTVVAGGGGGVGGRSSVDSLYKGAKGGAGGWPTGQDGGYPAVDNLHQSHGGSSLRPDQSRSGGDTMRGFVGGAGGGGGGGYHPGEGGSASTSAYGIAGGGGGGSSYYSSDLKDALTTQPGDDYKNADGGNAGNGSVIIRWDTNPDAPKLVAFRKVHTRFPAVLESTGPGTDQSGVDLSAQNLDSGLVASQLWTYKFLSQDQAGELVNKDTGLCLEVNGTNGDIDQWSCQSNAQNLFWYIANGPGADSVILITLKAETGGWAPGTYYLATKGDLNDVAEGATLTLESTNSSPNSAWTAVWQ